MKKLIVLAILVQLVALQVFAQPYRKEIKNATMNSKGGIYLRDFTIKFRKSSPEVWTVVLNKGTNYRFTAFTLLSEATLLNLQISDKDKKVLKSAQTASVNDTAKFNFECEQSGMYHISISPIDSKKGVGIGIMYFIAKTSNFTYQHNDSITKKNVCCDLDLLSKTETIDDLKYLYSFYANFNNLNQLATNSITAEIKLNSTDIYRLVLYASKKYKTNASADILNSKGELIAKLKTDASFQSAFWEYSPSESSGLTIKIYSGDQKEGCAAIYIYSKRK